MNVIGFIKQMGILIASKETRMQNDYMLSTGNAFRAPGSSSNQAIRSDLSCFSWISSSMLHHLPDRRLASLTFCSSFPSFRSYLARLYLALVQSTWE